MIKSQIQGSEGKIETYTSRLLGKKCYISRSATKWHDDRPFTRYLPIWFSVDEGIPSLYIGKLAIFYDKR